MRSASYLSRLVETGGKRRILLPPRLLFRPESSMADRVFSERIPTEATVADQDFSMRESNLTSSMTRPATSRKEASRSNTQLPTNQAPESLPQASSTTSNVATQMTRPLHHPQNAAPEITLPAQSAGPRSLSTERLNREPAARSARFENEGTKPTMSMVSAHNPLTPPKTIILGERRGVVDDKTAVTDTTVVPERKPYRQRMAPIELDDLIATDPVRKNSRREPPLETYAANDADRTRRVTLNPPPPPVSDTRKYRPENHERLRSHKAPALHIGTLEVRITPPPAPLMAAPQMPSKPRPAAPLAQGFRSFGLIQG